MCIHVYMHTCIHAYMHTCIFRFTGKKRKHPPSPTFFVFRKVANGFGVLCTTIDNFAELATGPVSCAPP